MGSRVLKLLTFVIITKRRKLRR